MRLKIGSNKAFISLEIPFTKVLIRPINIDSLLVAKLIRDFGDHPIRSGKQICVHHNHRWTQYVVRSNSSDDWEQQLQMVGRTLIQLYKLVER